MKTGDIVFLRRPYKGYRAVELMERLECRWLVRLTMQVTLFWPLYSQNLETLPRLSHSLAVQ